MNPDRATNIFERYFFSGVSPARPYLLLKGTLLLLAFDCWLLMSSHGGRYNVANFNVSHFGWLDAIQPTPTSALYVGALLLCGVVSLASFFVKPTRWALIAVTFLYTWAWASSMLDSYQHHYLLSLVLVNLCCFPLQSSKDVWRAEVQVSKKGKDVNRVIEAWGFVSLGVTCAIVYGYTAVTKLGADWRQGHALKRLTASQQWMRSLLRSFEDAGFSESTFWGLFALSAICVQLTVSLGYFLASQQDSVIKKPWFYKLVLLLGFGAAISFHAGVEGIHLEIGWFSYYMFWMAFVFFAPARFLFYLGAFLTSPAQKVQSVFSWSQRRPAKSVAVMLTVLVSVLVIGLGLALDMPGGKIAGFGSAIVLLFVFGFYFFKNEFSLIRTWALAVGTSVFLMWASILNSDVRFNFYRYTGYDLRKRGQYEEALNAYVKANKYAPPGKDRKRKEEELRRIVESRKN